MLSNETNVFLQLLLKHLSLSHWKKKVWIFFLCTIGNHPLIAQSTSLSDTIALQSLQKADFFYNEGSQLDSAYFYAKAAAPFFLQACDWENWYSSYWLIVLSLSQQGQSSEAFHWLRKGLHSATTVGMDERTIGKLYNLFGYLYFREGQFDKAYPAYSLSLEWLEKSGNLMGVESIYNNLGWLSTVRGEHEQALHYLRRALSIYLEKEQNYNAGDCHFNLGAAFMLMEKPDSAIQHYQMALVLYNYPDAATFLRISEVNLFKQANQEALEWANKALEIAQKEKDDATTPYSHLQMGDIYKKSGDYNRALQHFEIAHKQRLKIFGEKHRETTEILISIGDTYLQIEQHTQALKSYQSALQCLLPDSISLQKISSITAYFQDLQLQPDRYIGMGLERIGDALSASHTPQPSKENLVEILAHYEEALSVFSNIRMSYMNQADKLFWGSSLHELYEKAIRTAYQLSLMDKAYQKKVFGLMERSKSAVLLASIQEMEARQFANIPDSLSEQITQLKNTIAHLSYQKNSGTSSNVSQLEESIFAQKRQLDTLLLSIERNYPQYKSWQQDLQSTSLTDLQHQLLDANTLLLSFFVGKQKSYLAAIQQRDIQFFEIPNASLIEEKTAILHRTLSDRTLLLDTPQSSYQQYIESAYWLYENLLTKALQNFNGNQLIIIPDGQLGYVPFEILLTAVPDSSKRRYKQLPYLLRDYNLSYTYSATLLEKSQVAKTSNNPFSIAAFAPYAIGGEIAEQLSLPDSLLQNLTSLPFSNTELEVLSQQFKGNFYFGAEANEGEAKAALQDASILHFSTHTLIDDTHPMYSVLMFTPEDSLENEGYLYAYELYNRSVSAEMAVLSACETGYGKLSQGEGILSLSRAFVHAGCPSTVMSLWQIDDQASAKVVLNFYHYLQSGLTKDEALRQAKLQYLEETESAFAHPYYWAALVSTGNQKALDMKEDNWWMFWMIGGAVLIFLLIQYWRKD